VSTARRFLRGAALSAFSTGVALISLLAVAKMATNALPPEAVAVFALAMLMGDGLNLLGNLGLFASAPKLMAERPAAPDRARLLGDLLGGQALASGLVVAGLAVAWLVAPLLVDDTATLRTALIWAAPLSVLGAYRDTLLAAFAGCNRYAAHAAASVVFSAGQALMVYALVWQGEASVQRMLLAMVLAQAAGVALLLALARGGFRYPFSIAAYLAAARFSLPLFANTLLNFLFQRLDTLLVTALLGLHATALYEIAKRFPQVLSRVLNALLLPWLPTVTGLLAEGRQADAARALRKVVLAVTALGYAAIIPASLLSEKLIFLLASPDYIDAAPLLGLLMLGIHFAVQAGVFGQTLIALGQPIAVTVGNVAQAACSLGGAWLLLPHLGLTGMGCAWCLGAGISLLLQGSAVWRAGLRGWALPCFALNALFICALLPLL
jgi:O-antigen/teichoic acid export membrane protein